MQAAMDPAELRKRSRQELEQLVLKADAIIQAKDKDLAILAQTGQSLLKQYNNDLRRQYDPSLLRTPPLVLSPSVASLFAASSNQQSIKRKPRTPSGDWQTDEEEADKRRTPNMLSSHGSYRRHSRPRGHSSARSSVSSLSAADISRVSPSPESSLSALNAELIGQIEELEAETVKNAAQSKRKMKRLEREMSEMKQDYDKMLGRNQELEHKLRSRAIADIRSRRSSSESSLKDAQTYGWPPGEIDEDRTPEASVDPGSPPTVYRSLDAATPTRPSIHSRDSTLTISECSSRPTLSRRNSESDSMVVQLLARVAELEESHQNTCQERDEMSERLFRAQQEMMDLKQSNEEFEEVLRAQEEQSRHERSLQSWRKDVGTRKARARQPARRAKTKPEPDSPSASSVTTNSAYSPSKPSRLSQSSLPNNFTPESANESEGSSTLSPFHSLERNTNTLQAELGQASFSDDEADVENDSPIPFHRHPDIVAALESIHAEHSSVWQDEEPIEVEDDEPPPPPPARSSMQFDSLRIARNRKKHRASLRSFDRTRTESAFSGETLIDELASINQSLTPQPKVHFKIEDEWEMVEERGVIRPNASWPLTVRTRYHPKTVMQRSATFVLGQGLVAFIWIRFLFVLLWAVVSAVRKGPEDLIGKKKIKDGEEEKAE